MCNLFNPRNALCSLVLIKYDYLCKHLCTDVLCIPNATPTTLNSAADANLYKATAIRFSTGIGSLTQRSSNKRSTFTQ